MIVIVVVINSTIDSTAKIIVVVVWVVVWTAEIITVVGVSRVSNSGSNRNDKSGRYSSSNRCNHSRRSHEGV